MGGGLGQVSAKILHIWKAAPCLQIAACELPSKLGRLLHQGFQHLLRRGGLVEVGHCLNKSAQVPGLALPCGAAKMLRGYQRH